MANPSSAKSKETRYVQGGETTVHQKSVGWWERDNSISVKANGDIEITSLPAVYNGRPDLLSYDLYGNNNLEWIILQYNHIVDINEEFVTGARLFAPSKARVFGSILIKTIAHGD